MTAVTAPPAARDVPDLAGYPGFLRPRVATDGAYYAGFWVRAGVNVVDLAIQAILYLVVSYIVQAIAGIVGGFAHYDADAASRGVSIGCALAVFVFYSTTIVARNAATPGMRMASMRIVNDADIATAPSRRTLYMRGLLWIAFSATGILRIIDAVYVAFDPRKRSVHDLVTGTAVVRRAPRPPHLASLLCDVCGRPVDEGSLCPRHGGSLGLTITLSGHTVSMQIAASLLTILSLAAIIVGVVMLVTGTVVGGAALLVGIALLRTTMALTQLRSWARWVGIGAGAVIAVAGVAAGLAQLLGSNSAGGFLVAGGVVGALIVGCLWTPETYRAFRRVP